MKIQRATILLSILTIGGLICTVGMLFFLILPTLHKAQQLKQQIGAAQSEIEAQYLNRKNLLQIQSDLQKAKESLNVVSQQFMQPGHELDFITSIEKISSKDGVTSSLQLDPNAKKDSVPEFGEGYSLSVTGSFPAIDLFLTDLERMPTLVSIESFSMQGTDVISVSLSGFIATSPGNL